MRCVAGFVVGQIIALPAEIQRRLA